jgi:acetyl-CoA C-acetyltransferase
MFDCCPQTDGAAAAILCRADLAEKFTDKPIYISGMALGTDHPQLFEKRNYIEWDATIHAAKRAYQMAGIEPKDLDLAEVHDCFSITELINYEDLGFCDKGDGGKLIEEGETEIGGRIPVNPSGGLMTKGHPVGATGVAQVAEIFWQLREEVRDSGGFGNPDINEKRQVTLKKGYGLNHNIGGRGFANAAVNIFTNKKI